jgi:hypothetical protein
MCRQPRAGSASRVLIERAPESDRSGEPLVVRRSRRASLPDVAPRENRAATRDRRDVPGYWITSSARNGDRGIASPSGFAAFKLTMSSNRVGGSTGRSAGYAPSRILSTYAAAIT